MFDDWLCVLQKAEAGLAYELQAAKVQQKIKSEEMQVNVIQRRKQIEIEEQEILRREKELVATVRLPAEAESYRVALVAQGQRTQVVEKARAEAEKVKLVGLAEATAIENIGRAEAEAMRMKASAFKLYGEAATLSLVFEALPKIAAEVAAPLAKTESIVMMSGSSGAAGGITKLVGQIPPAVQALTGVDLSDVLRNIPGAK